MAEDYAEKEDSQLLIAEENKEVKASLHMMTEDDEED